jgi:lipopolysaccharide biosynthesis glycosyltransferase
MASVSPIHVACAVNRRYLPHAAAMLASLFESNPDESFAIYLFVDADVGQQEQQRITEFVAAHGHTLACRESHSNIPAAVPVTERFSAAAWFRVLLPDLLPDLSRVLYLDVDLLVLRPIRSLWEQDLDGYYVAAVNNPLYPQMDKKPVLSLGLASVAEYFNSGVLLMNLARCRQDNVAERVFSLAIERPEITRFADQEPLNAALYGGVRLLPPVWNVQNQFYDLSLRELQQMGFERKEIVELRARPAVLHFSGPWKPWHMRCAHQKKSLYRHYRKQTPWGDWTLDRDSWKDRWLSFIPARLQIVWLLFRRRAG